VTAGAAGAVQRQAQSIYCDESGFTGGNLLDSQQPTFAYSAVAIEREEADELLARARAALGIANLGEMKSGTLYGSRKGRAALAEVVRAVGDRSLVFMADKKFALACKFFEYVFEPILSENNAFFYRRGFHKFIANLLYLKLRINDPTAEQMVVAFQRFMRSRDAGEIAAMLGTDMDEDVDPLKQMLDIANAYRDQIGDELNTLGGNDAVGKCVLDLTTSGLFVLLGAWGERFPQLDVFCDRSKPLESYPELFAVTVGRQERSYMTFEDRATPITFNLARPISFVDSRDHAGVRVADLVAGAVTYGAREDDPEAAAFRAAIGDVVSVLPLSPQPQYVDLEAKEPFLNAILLRQLHQRAQVGDDPLSGIVEEQLLFAERYAKSPPRLGRRGRR
jgi:uncharacterized protein DUF3800